MTAKVRLQYGPLLFVLLATLIAQPFLGAGKIADVFLDSAVVVTLTVALPAIWDERKIRVLALSLGIVAIAVSATARSLGVDSAYPFGAVLRVMFFGLLIFAIFAEIFRRQRVNMDAVLGACCVYVLMGMTWAAAYSMLEWLQPGSFHFAAFSSGATSDFVRTTVSFKLEYYSLITMTSVGYGDIVPVSPPARMLAALEALSGQLYLAIIIGRMVGLAISQRNQ